MWWYQSNINVQSGDDFTIAYHHPNYKWHELIICRAWKQKNRYAWTVVLILHSDISHIPLFEMQNPCLPSLIVQPQPIQVNHEITPSLFSSFARTMGYVISSPCHLELSIIHLIHSRVNMQLHNWGRHQVLTGWVVWSMEERLQNIFPSSSAAVTEIIFTLLVLPSSFSHATRPLLSALPLILSHPFLPYRH